MAITTGLTLAALLVLQQPQAGGGEQDKPLLSVAELKSLNKKLAAWIEAKKDYDDAPMNRRPAASRKHEKAKESFIKEWESRSEKVKTDLLKSIPDLRAIFDNVLPYDRASGSNSIKRLELKDPRAPEKYYALYVPRSYRVDEPLRTVVVIPGRRGESDWVEAREWFENTWGGSESLKDTVFNVTQVPNDFEFEPVPDFSKEGEDAKEVKRIALVLVSWGVTMKTYNLDRDRIYLDAGHGSTGFALRLATMFPDRFAGLILRNPADVPDIRLGSLNGMPVIAVADGASKAEAGKLQQRLNALKDGSCRLLDATDEYPFKASAPELEKWMAETKRDLMIPRVVVEPNHPRFTKAYWVSIEHMDNIIGVPLDKRARIEVQANRKQNRITVKAEGVSAFTLLLNDQLADLDDPNGITIVVNGQAQVHKRGRDFGRMFDLLYKQKLDTGWLFPAIVECAVPRSETAKDGNGEK
ncbi:MAG: hypothetical protein Fur0037_18440 [Planctomycetota bacterium]